MFSLLLDFSRNPSIIEVSLLLFFLCSTFTKHNPFKTGWKKWGTLEMKKNQKNKTNKEFGKTLD